MLRVVFMVILSLPLYSAGDPTKRVPQIGAVGMVESAQVEVKRRLQAVASNIT